VRAIEKYYAKKSLEQIKLAYDSNSITQWAKAAELDLSDPEIANLSMEEATQVIQVLLADKMKRIKELLGEQK
jgi:hypothetical protein